jgi:hypothetical protein
MITWLVAALVYATSLAQQSQGLVSQSTLDPPSPAASTDRPDAKTPPAAKTAPRQAAAPADAQKPAATEKSESKTKAAEPPPSPDAPKVAPDEKKPAPGARVAAFWFILPRK